jgi:hypothetical protein
MRVIICRNQLGETSPMAHIWRINMMAAACIKEFEVQNRLLLDSSIFSDLVPPRWRFLVVMVQVMPATYPRPSVVARRA